MTAAELTAQIRAAKPTAPEALRERVRAIATAEPAAVRRARLRLPRLRIILPVTAATAVAAATAITLVRPQAQHPQPQSAGPLNAATAELSPTTTSPTTDATGRSDHVAAAPAAPAFKNAAPVPTTGRATRFAAQLTVSVKNANALSDATARAQAIVRGLGGYVVNVSFASSDSGVASLTLRVPSAQVQDALTRLAALGRVVSQQVQIDDLQATLDQLGRRITVLRSRIAHVTALLSDTSLSDVRRAELEAQRVELQNALRATHQSRSITAGEARFATIQLQLQTAAKAVAPPPSRANRILHQAGRILAWEGAAALYALVVAGPFALLAAGLTLAARTRRRGEETRLLARS